MTNINCFQECLGCNRDEESSEHYFKIKKGRKFITLAKNVSKGVHNPVQLITYSSAVTEPQQITEINIQKQYKQTLPRKQVRNFRSQQRERATMSPIRAFVPRESLNRPHKLLVRPVQILPRSLQPRQRRYSLDNTPKPFLGQKNIMFVDKPSKQCSNSIEIRCLSPNSQLISKAQELISKPLYQYQMNPIKEEEQKQKCSSLFQGAKSIVSRMVTSRKENTVVNTIRKQAQEHHDKHNIHKFYDSARLCETQNAIVLTHSSIASEQQEKKLYLFQEISIDSIPMSPHSKNSMSYGNFKIGRLLGVGKWAHVYLSQQKSTNCLFATKQIFKQSFKIACSVTTFKDSINKLISLNHSNLVNLYTKFQTKDRLCLISEVCNKCLYDQLKERGFLSIPKVRKYAADLIKAIVYLHQCQIVHGNVNVFQVFDCFGEGKLKNSLTQIAYASKWPLMSYKRDIEGLAIVIFEMGHGLIQLSVETETLYQKQKLYQQIQTREKIRQLISSRVELSESDASYRLLNQLIKMLLNWDTSCRLTASICLTHPFFIGKDS